MTREEKKIIEVIVADDQVLDDVIFALKDEHATHRFSKDLAPDYPRECEGSFILVKSDSLPESIALAQFLASEIPRVIYCGPNHPHERFCIGQKLAKVKQDYMILVKRASAVRPTNGFVELHVA